MSRLVHTRPGSMLDAALLFAITAHRGQFDKGDRPYILHPLTVMYKLKSDDEELECIALLHDCIEDTEATYESLRMIGMTERVIAGIDALTKRRGETYEEYKERVKSNYDAVRVKKSDLRHNSDIRRLKGVTDKDLARVQRYHKFWKELCEVEQYFQSLQFMPSAGG